MADVHLRTLLTAGGLRSVNFFNGRLLSGEDLGDERAALREVDARLGIAAGTGVAHGLFVALPAKREKARPAVTVTGGLAVAPSGRTLSLPSTVTVLLTRPDDAAGEPGEFGTCLPPQGTAYVAGAGVYLLTITWGRAAEGRVPVSGLGNGPAPCNSRYLVEGVQFRLVQLPVTDEALAQPDLLRNRLAYEVCLGVVGDAYEDPLIDPADLPHPPDPPGYGLLDRLADTGSLGPDEVPLAVLYWTSSGGVRFVDRWAVRRRLVRPDAGGWPFLSDRRQAEAEAMLYQFQDHLADLLADPEPPQGFDPAKLQLRDRFAYLPPVGVVPVGSGAFDQATFFGGLLRHATPPAVDASLVRPLLLESFRHEPLRVARLERLQLYHIHDDLRPFDSRREGGAVVFAGQTLPYFGVARYDVARYDRSRFGPEAT